MGRPEKSVTETESCEPAATERASCVVGEYLRGSYDITCSDRVIFGSEKVWVEEIEFALLGEASVGQHHLG